MAKLGRMDFTEFVALKRKLEAARDGGETFLIDLDREVGARLLRKVIKRTPVGDYTEEIEVVAKRKSKHHNKGDVYKKRINPTGKIGGTLRRGWTIESPVRSGDRYAINIINPVEYAHYVEHGHRQQPGRYVPAIGKRLKKSWVPGHFMVKESEKELQKQLPQIVSRKLNIYMKGHLND